MKKLDRQHISGIYAIKNSINNKVYIGSSKSIRFRFYEHKYDLNKGDHSSQHLQSSWNKYGKNNFRFEIIEECAIDFLIEKEEFWIEHFKSHNRKYGYNSIRIIENHYFHNEETKQKIMDKSWNIKKEEIIQSNKIEADYHNMTRRNQF